MGLDADLNVILRDIVQFLECLRDVKLSSALESVRENLLRRSKTTLSNLTTTDRPTLTAEPYLVMSPSSRGLLQLQIGETKELGSQEYVGVEDTIKTENQKCRKSQTHPDYYEPFQPVVPEVAKKKEVKVSQENALLGIYRNLPAAQAESKSIKCGPLYRKEGKKLFLSEQYRFSWVALVGTYLLIYSSKRDNKPQIIHGIRGYQGRATPSERDHQKNGATFEIIKPGTKTLQFTAGTRLEMEQWVSHICQVGSYGSNTSDQISNLIEDVCLQPSTGTTVEAEKIISKDYPADSKLKTTVATTDEIKAVKSEQERKTIITNRESPPPLPTHIPTSLTRRLSSVPPRDEILSYETMNGEESIYSNIDELGNDTRYQNTVIKHQCEESKKVVAHDGVPPILKKERQNVNLISKEKNVSSMFQNENRVSFEETYDDIAGASDMRKKTGRDVIRREDVNDACESQSNTLTSVISSGDTETQTNAASPGNKVKNKDKEAQKKCVFPNKKTFLDRMRNRKESPQKKEKIIASRWEPLIPPQIVQTEEKIYDDVSDLKAVMRASVPEEIPEYNCPPTPRPVYAEALSEEEAIYDDINGYHPKEDQQLKQQMQSNIQNLGKRVPDDNEHYKAPRSDISQYPVGVQMEEQLYDDIALSTSFAARPRQSSEEIRDQDSSKSSSSSDKRSWNRFVTNRKSKLNNSTSSVSNKRASSEVTDTDSSEEQPNISKNKNTFQKIRNKMENSLGFQERNRQHP